MNTTTSATAGIAPIELPVDTSLGAFYRDLHASYESVVSAEGMYLQTASGQRILDAVGGAGTVVLGHGVREITDAVARHGGELSFVYGAKPYPEFKEAIDTVLAQAR